jgi:glycosyltransferase involved in cell wall biosynthesis
MRRILVVSSMFPKPEAPCNGTFVHEQVKALRGRGIDARVLCARPFPLYLRRPWGVPGRWRQYRRGWSRPHWVDVDGVPVLHVPFHVGWSARLLRQADPFGEALRHGGDWLRDHFPCDLIHAHTAHPDGYAALALARLYRKPLVVTEHTNPFALLTREPTLRHKTLTTIAAADRVWCVSDALTQEVRSYFPPAGQSHIRTLFNGVDTTLFQPPPRWQPDRTAPRLLFVGFLVEFKNVPLLLESFARLRQTLPGAPLNQAGDGPLREQIERQIAGLGLGEAVRPLGECSRSRVADLLRDECDILVLPSRSETFGVVLIEALASGKPVVATRCGGPESVVTESFLGTLCAVNDAEALAAALRETADRLPGFDPLQIRHHAVERFDYRNLAAELARQYGEILAAPLARAAG